MILWLQATPSTHWVLLARTPSSTKILHCKICKKESYNFALYPSFYTTKSASTSTNFLLFCHKLSSWALGSVHILRISSSSISDVLITISIGNHSTSPHTGLISINAVTLIPFKLSKGDNYASWCARFFNLLFGYDLLGYVDDSLSCPPAIINIPEEPNPVPNPTHKLWVR